MFLETGSHSTAPSSRSNFHKWHRISDAAADLLRVSPTDPEKKTTWEHCRPLNAMSEMVIEEQASPQRLLEIVGEYPPVVVLKTEVPTGEFANSGHPDDRYRAFRHSTLELKSDRWKEQAKHLFVNQS